MRTERNYRKIQESQCTMLNNIKNFRNKYLSWRRHRKHERLYQSDIGKHLISADKANDLIYNKIIENKPCFITRFGSSELACLLFYRQARLADPLINKWNAHHEHILCDVSGFFPFTEVAMDKFSRHYLSFIQNIDILGAWQIGEENVADLFDKRIKLVNLSSIEPYYFQEPWSRALAGRKVLVVHPFAESIKMQYAKRALLFSDRDVLPDFELQVIAAAQTLLNNTGGFNDWFETLDNMCSQIAKADFDVAIIGAGAYGMPIANFIKMKMGKVAIHMGGATQILFGIKGKRWNDIPQVKSLFNEYWINPSANEKPAGAEKVEGGSYW